MSAATFTFRALDGAGAPAAGELEAESKAQVSEQLRQRGLIVLDVSEKSEPFNIEDVFKRFQGIDMRALAVFSRQFATLVASGMPMLRTLHTLEEQTSRPAPRWSRRWSATRRSSTACFGPWSAPASSLGGWRTRSTGSPSRSRKPTPCAAR
jgi:type II secretory pathway component PulF